MGINEKIHNELLKSLTKFSEANLSFKLYKNNSNSITSPHKKNFHRFSSYLIEKKKTKLKNNNINSSKINHQHRHHHKSTDLTSNFNLKNHLYKRDRYKTQDKNIKINLVNQKFKIADDFNEKNSNQFLNEKDEYLREVILSDKIEEEKAIHFYGENEKRNIYELSSISKNESNDDLNCKAKRKIVKDDSVKFLWELIKDLK